MPFIPPIVVQIPGDKVVDRTVNRPALGYQLLVVSRERIEKSLEQLELFELSLILPPVSVSEKGSNSS